MTEPARERALIDRLVADAGPVRRLWSPEVRLAIWLVLAALVLVVPATRVLRADVSLQLENAAFVFEEGLLLVGAVLLGLEAMRAAVPGRPAGRATTIVGWGALGLGLVWMLREPVHGAWTVDTFLDVGRHCIWRALAWGAVPWLILLVALRRGAPLARRRAGALAGAATWALVCPALRVCCQTDEVLHPSVFHALPLVGGVLASAALGPVLLGEGRVT
jgi:hypothetical protein